MFEIIVSMLIGIIIGTILTAVLLKRRQMAHKDLENSIKLMASEALRSNNQEFIKQASNNIEALLEKTKNEFGKQAISDTLKPLKEQIDRYDNQIKKFEQQRNEQYGGINARIKGLLEQTNKLSKETDSLVNMLKRPEARGRLGEITLRRIIEMAGLQEHISFTEQEKAEDANLRPDMIVDLPNRGRIIIDSKVTLKPLINAYEEPDEVRKNEYIAEYHKAVKSHIRKLASKKYWAHFENSPDFVLMFMPGESFYFEAVKQDSELIEKAIQDRVVIVTPTTLLALLRTIAIAWQEHDISENAKHIADMGTDLFDRIRIFAEHYKELGSKLDSTVDVYNKGIGSFNSRLMPGIKKLKDLSCPASKDEVEIGDGIEKKIRDF
ncbi:MAG: DNA recombination protein RmuC [Candidatus Zixiibacteriota bacterium]